MATGLFAFLDELYCAPPSSEPSWSCALPEEDVVEEVGRNTRSEWCDLSLPGHLRLVTTRV